MERIKRTLDRVDKFRRKRNVDWIFLICGQTGAGKTNLGGMCCDYLYKKVQKEFEPEVGMSNTPYELVYALKNTERFGAILDDEGMKDKMSRRAMSTENIEQLSTFAQTRQNRNLIVFVIVQDMTLLEKPIKNNFARGIIRCVFSRGQDSFPTQGKVLVYGVKAMRKIRIDKDGVVKWPKANYIDYVGSLEKENPELWKKMDERSGRQKNDSIQDSLDRIDSKQKNKKKFTIQMDMYMLSLRKKRKSIRQIQKLLQQQFGTTYSIGMIHRKLKQASYK